MQHVRNWPYGKQSELQEAQRTAAAAHEDRSRLEAHVAELQQKLKASHEESGGTEDKDKVRHTHRPWLHLKRSLPKRREHRRREYRSSSMSVDQLMQRTPKRTQYECH